MELDLGAVRAFVAVAEDRYFSDAAVRLGVSQQAVSKRIAKLESDLGATLLVRSHGGTELTEDGTAFLTHARALVGLADQAVEQLQGRRRPLRVDVLGTRLATMDLIRTFHQVHEVELEIVTPGLNSPRPTVVPNSVDAVFAPSAGVSDTAVERIPAYLDPAHLLVGRGHRLARRRRVELAELAGMTAWLPSNAPDREWTEFYRALSAEFPFGIDTSGPDFGLDHYVEMLSKSTERFGFVSERMHVPWHPDAVQIPVVKPTPVYPWSLLWRRDNRHPALPLLVEHIRAGYRPFDPERHWLPSGDRAAFMRG
jgi:DNA-binding transcriptional LysR family regulator